MKTRLPPFALLALLLPACQPKDEGTTDDTSAVDSGDIHETGETGDSDSGTTSATIAITGPGEGDSYLGPTLTYSVAGLTLDPAAMGGPAVPGQGHVHIKVDDAYVDATAELSYTLTAEQLPAGVHSVSACLAANDHTELGPCDSITLNVLAPSVTVTSPADGVTLDSRGVQVAFDTSDFTFSPDIDGVNVIGAGHYHLMLDGAYYTLGTDPTQAFFLHLSSGTHELGVALVNNDHSDLPAPVMSTVTVTVPADAPDIRVDSPAANPGYNSASIPFVATPENFVFDADLSGTMPNMDGMGHYHVYLDGVYDHAAGTTDDWLLHLPAGTHTIGLVLANYDHTELGARDTITVDVAAARPDVMITSPPSGEIVPSDFTVQVDVENFILDPDAVGGTNVDGVGHYHVYVDGVYNALGAGGAVDVTGVEPGYHTLRVELVGNAHFTLDPVVYDEIPIYVE